jgi:signal transduction histidine kinase
MLDWIKGITKRACWPVFTQVLPMLSLAFLAAGLFGWALVSRMAAESLSLFHEDEIVFVLVGVGVATAILARIMGHVSRSLHSLVRNQEEAQRRAEEKAEVLKGTLDDMRQLDRAKDDFLILISHEVRTPLTAIMSGVDFLKSSVAQVQGPDRRILDRLNVAEIAEIIEGSGQRLKRFMNDAIQMTAIQSRTRQLELVAVPPGSLVEVGLCGIREKATPRRINVVNELNEATDWAILGDQTVLKMAFEKVLHNALVHNHDEGDIIIREAQGVPGLGVRDWLPTPEAVNRLKGHLTYGRWAARQLRWRLIEVFNTGDPIPKDRQQALFGKFELVGRIEHHQKGSGLSMPIAGSAIENHGGRIFVHSVPGKGNSFFLLLPTVMDKQGDLAASVPSSWDEETEGVGSGPGDEQIDLAGDPAGLEVELDDAGAALASGPHQTGGGIDGPGSPDHEEQITL